MNEQQDRPNDQGGSILSRATSQYAVVGIVAGIIFPTIATVLKIAGLQVAFSLANILHVQQTEPVLWITDLAPCVLGFVAGIAGWRQDLVLQANSVLRQRESDLNGIRAALEERVSVRTRELDLRNAQMRSVIAFARQVAEIQDLASLLSTSAEIIGRRFDQYDASVFLLDEARQYAVLKASSTLGGKDLTDKGFRVAVGDQSLVGRAARRGKMQLFPAGPERPEPTGRTSSTGSASPEAAIPLVVRGRIIGVLTIQSHNSMPMDQGEAEMFQLFADQLGSAIENVRLATESLDAGKQLEALTTEATRSAWQKHTESNAVAYQFTADGIKTLTPGANADVAGSLSVPLVLRGQKIGSIGAHKRSSGNWSPGEQDFVEKVAAQVALALENARLLDATRQRAAQEQIVSEISARFSRSLDVDALLQAAVREFASLPDVAEASVLLQARERVGTSDTKMSK